MAVIKDVNIKNFDENISKGKVVVYFSASWCGPCKVLSPVYDQVSNELEDIKFIKIDIDDQEQLAQKFGIMSIPTLITFENGSKKAIWNGSIEKQKLIEFIKK